MVCEDCSNRLDIKVWVVVEMFGGMVDSLFVYDNEEAARGHWEAWWLCPTCGGKWEAYPLGGRKSNRMTEPAARSPRRIRHEQG